MKKCFVTFEEIVSMENLCVAWEEFIPGKRKKKDVEVFALNLMDELWFLHTELMNETYQHGAYEHFKISDPKPRDIHKAFVRDRVLHHAIHRKLYPFFALMFVADSFSCQTGKGVHCALKRFTKFGRCVGRNNTQVCWVLKCDIRKFFASVHHETLRLLLKDRIDDERILRLLNTVIASFFVLPGRGVPLGNLTSQLFASIYLHELDVYVKRDLKQKYYVRYADDFVFLSAQKDKLEGLLDSLKLFLQENLLLEMHPNKIFLKTLSSGADFLGWVHFPDHRVIRTKTKRRMNKRLRSEASEQSVHSYLGLLSHGNTYKIQQRVKNNDWFW